MAYFAKLDDDNIVTEVIAISNLDCGNFAYPESEPVGQAFIANTLNLEGVWLQTSFTASFRSVYAGIGYTYDAALDMFLAPPEPEPVPTPEA